MSRFSRVPPSLRLALPLVAVLAGVGLLTVVAQQTRAGVGETSEGGAPPSPEPGLGVTITLPEEAPPVAREEGRFGPDGAILAPPSSDEYQCLQPDLPVVRAPGCEAGSEYPACRWQLPDTPDAGGLYRVWRNTIPEHRWARPGLVSLVMASAREYAQRWPGETVAIGDLDAPGPRHQTHKTGVDVDLYLEDAMIARNLGGRQYPDNYEGKPASVVRMLRARVNDLAQILAVCARGQIRIYYNDPEIITPFREWFTARGLVSSVGRPMQMHNPLHRFHFHMTVAPDLEPLPIAR